MVQKIIVQMKAEFDRALLVLIIRYETFKLHKYDNFVTERLEYSLPTFLKNTTDYKYHNLM